jgi:hypothetical protein
MQVVSGGIGAVNRQCAARGLHGPGILTGFDLPLQSGDQGRASHIFDGLPHRGHGGQLPCLFTKTSDLTVYEALPNQIPLDEMNPPIARLRGLQRRLALASMRMDFSRPDAAPEDLLSPVIWHSVKGYNTPYPGRDEDNERRAGK